MSETGGFDRFFAELANAASPTGYLARDRYTEFRAVFLSDVRGRRVLNEILGWAHLHKTSVQPGRPIDPYATHVAEGERNIGVRLLVTLNAEPVDKPVSAITKEAKD